MSKRRLGTIFFAVVVLAFSSLLASAQSSDKPSNKSEADVLVVPAGTQIKVTFTQPRCEMRQPYVVEGKVTVPVRAGWATAIPAGSKAFVTVVPAFYNADGSRRAQQVQNEMALTAVIIGDVKYNVVTNSIALLTSTAGTDAEVGFALVEALRVAR